MAQIDDRQQQAHTKDLTAKGRFGPFPVSSPHIKINCSFIFGHRGQRERSIFQPKVVYETEEMKTSTGPVEVERTVPNLLKCDINYAVSQWSKMGGRFPVICIFFSISGGTRKEKLSESFVLLFKQKKSSDWFRRNSTRIIHRVFLSAKLQFIMFKGVV